MRYVVLVLVLVLGAALAIFGLQNTARVQVSFLGFQSGTISLAVVIGLSAALGMLIVWLLNVPGMIHRRIEARRIHKHTAALEQQVAELKARLPPPVMRPLPGEALPNEPLKPSR